MVTINEQAFLFLACVKTGIIMGVLYDLIRIVRKIIRHPNWLVQLEDLLYWITCGCFAFIMIYWKNYGQIRGFVFLGILIGAVLYFSTVSNLVVKIIMQIINFVLIPIKCILLTIGIPIKYIAKKYHLINGSIKRRANKRKIKWNTNKAKIKKQFKIIKSKK